MNKDLAIVTMVIGGEYERVSRSTLPTMQAYADRIDADLIVLRTQAFPQYQLYWEKFQIARLFGKYARVLWLDADIVVRPTAPSIFDQAPADTFGAFDEGKYFNDRFKELEKDGPFYGIMSQRPVVERGFSYFNAGVMLTSRIHQELFTLPLHGKRDAMSEQTYTNIMLSHRGLKFHDLGIQWNGLHSLRRADDRKDLHIIHYAGWPKVPGWVDRVTSQMKKDLES